MNRQSNARVRRRPRPKRMTAEAVPVSFERVRALNGDAWVVSSVRGTSGGTVSRAEREGLSVPDRLVAISAAVVFRIFRLFLFGRGGSRRIRWGGRLRNRNG